MVRMIRDSYSYSHCYLFTLERSWKDVVCLNCFVPSFSFFPFLFSLFVWLMRRVVVRPHAPTPDTRLVFFGNVDIRDAYDTLGIRGCSLSDSRSTLSAHFSLAEQLMPLRGLMVVYLGSGSN